MSIFTGVAEGAADGRLVCSAERTTWLEDGCCDFDLEVPEPSMLRCGSVPGNRTKNRKEINKTRKGQRTVLITGLSPKRGRKKTHGAKISLGVVSEALILLLEGFPIACLLRLPPLGLVLLPLVGRCWALLLRTCCPILFPPLGLDLSPPKGATGF